jgi:bifunctional non-homologous end joining protein LigD
MASSVKTRRGGAKKASARSSSRASVEAQLGQIQTDSGDGMVNVGRGTSIHVSSLDKVYFPADHITKGDVMRYYAGVAPFILPVIKDRPLILKRFPDGIDGPSFFQQNAGQHVPDAVRTERVSTAAGERAQRIVGGDLVTLLYTVQIGTIAVHSWQARIQTAEFADTTTVDLDPGDDVPFAAVVTLAKSIKIELDKLGLWGGIKTSGSSGLHIVLPLAPKTEFALAARLAEVIAERVVEKQPDRATVERSIKARPAGTIYVDAQQNAEGKSVVAAYSVRERIGATVSAPLDWSELRRGLRLEAFTIKTMPGRLERVGDLWGPAMKRRNTRRVIERVLRNA